MSNIGDRLRTLFDESAPRLSVANIPRSFEPKVTTRRPWLLGIVAAVMVLVVGGAALTLSVRDHGDPSNQAAAPNTETEESRPEAAIGWTQWDLPVDFNVHTITVANGRFFGLARAEYGAPDARTRLWVSIDGTTWDAIDVDASVFGMQHGYFRQIATVGDGFAAVFKGEPLVPGDPEIVLLTSEDARTWSRVDTGAADALPMAVAADGDAGGIALVGTPGDNGYTYAVWHSTDGVDWTQTVSAAFPGMGPHQPVVAFGGSFYFVSFRDDRPPALLTSTDGVDWTELQFPPLGAAWAGWAIPSGTPTGLILFTGGTSDSQLWLMSTPGSWTDITPPGFDATADSSNLGNSVVGSSGGSPIMIMDAGQSGGPQDPNYYLPSTIWWSLDGLLWDRLPGSEIHGFEGVIRLASATGDRIIVVVQSHPDLDVSLWAGEVLNTG